MKTFIQIIVICLFPGLTSGLYAQEKIAATKEKVEIKTSAVCNMCKATIEKALKKEEGVLKARLNVSTKMVAVTYDPAKTNPEKIKKAITLSGYDAGAMPADTAAYSKLHDCCKKDAH